MKSNNKKVEQKVKTKKISNLLCIDSTFRNRNKHPSPYKFDVQVKMNKTLEDSGNADIVSDQAPLATWSPDDISNATGKIEYIMSDETFTTFQVRYENQPYISESFNYYKNIQVTYGSPVETNYITYWQFSYTTQANHKVFIVKVRNTPQTTIPINSDMKFVVDFSPYFFFIPGDIIFKNSDYFIVNNTQKQSTKVLYYHKETNKVCTPNPPLTWVSSDTYSIRLDIPTVYYEVGNVGSMFVTQNSNISFVVIVPIITSSLMDSFYMFVNIDPLSSSFLNNNTYFRLSYINIHIEISDGDVNVNDTIQEYGTSNPRRITILSEMERSLHFYKNEGPFTSGNEFVDVNQLIPTDDLSWEFKIQFDNGVQNVVFRPLRTGFSLPVDKISTLFINKVQNSIGLNLHNNIGYFTYTNPAGTFLSYGNNNINIKNSSFPTTVEFYSKIVQESNGTYSTSNLILFCFGYQDLYFNATNITCFITKTNVSNTITVYNTINHKYEFIDATVDCFDNQYHYFVFKFFQNDIKLFIDGIDQGSVSPAVSNTISFKPKGVNIGKNIIGGIGNTVDNKIEFKHFRLFDDNYDWSQSEINTRYGLADTSFFTSHREISLNTNVFDGKSHHFIVTFDMKTKEVYVYIDGQLQNSFIFSDYNNPNTTGIHIHNNNDPDNRYTIQDVQLYNLVLDSMHMNNLFEPSNSKQYLCRYNSGDFDVNTTYKLFNNDKQITFKIINTLFCTNDPTVAPHKGDIIEVFDKTYDSESVILKPNNSKEKVLDTTIRFLSLSIPNIESKYASNIFKYPYLFLKLYNNNHSTKDKLMSNNPNNSDMLFQIPVKYDDVDGRFVNISNVGDIQQSIDFDINKDFHVEVCTPNGEIISPLMSDTTMPVIPNPALQIYLKLEIIQTIEE